MITSVVKKLTSVSTAVNLACDEHIAKDVAGVLKDAITVIQQLDRALQYAVEKGK